MTNVQKIEQKAKEKLNQDLAKRYGKFEMPNTEDEEKKTHGRSQ